MNSIPPTAWQRVLVLAVHPDDESLSAGGLIQKAIESGADVRVVFVTDGDNNPWPQRFVERRWRIDAVAGARWGKRRRAEAIAALGVLGVAENKITFWHYPDQGVTRLLRAGGADLIKKIAAELCEWKPTLLVAPSMRDLHPDHNALAVLLYFALAQNEFYEKSPCTLLKYLVHARGEPPGNTEIHQIVLSPDQQEKKRRAILCHDTQMALSRRRFLAFAKEKEQFLVPSPARLHRELHPVFDADFCGKDLRLKLKLSARKPILFLVTNTPDAVVCQTIDLASDLKPAIRDASTGEIFAKARVVRTADQWEVFIPLRTMEKAGRLFVKLVAGRKFYNGSGWREIPISQRPSVAEVAPHANATLPRVCCVIPCYNLAGVCGPIVRAAAGYAEQIIAVNDGSSDDTERVLREVARDFDGRVHVVNFAENRGKGVALLEAFRYALASVPFEVLVTLDGDGQHRPEDIPRLAAECANEQTSLVIGERLSRVVMPLRSRFGNTLTALLMNWFYPGAPQDTQSGFRALQREFVREVVDHIEGRRYETELEILLFALKKRQRIGSVTIPTVYLDGNRLSHFRPILDSWRIYRTLLRWQFRGAKKVSIIEPQVDASLERQ
ncbi:MAG: PIG-L family deacetylase [Verrucomicrobiota bacterium]